MVERGAQIYWCWSARAVLNASRDFAHATVSGRWFQRMTVSTKKLFWYWAVLLFGMVKHFVLLVLCFSTGLMVTQSPNVFGFICLSLLLLNVTKASVGRAGINPSTTLYITMRRRLCRLSSSVSSSSSFLMFVIHPSSIWVQLN